MRYGAKGTEQNAEEITGKIATVELKVKRLDAMVDFTKDSSWGQHRNAAIQELADLKKALNDHVVIERSE